tara:strand:+ start:396 stop:725 length:330 start_codon:yes stop_codon:yes gene_type:complete
MSGDKIPDLDSSGKFVTPLSGNEVYKTRKEVVNANLSGEISTERFYELLGVYMEAEAEAPEYGFVGVGCISFAEAMLQDHQGAVVKPIRIPTLYTDEDFNKENKENNEI